MRNGPALLLLVTLAAACSPAPTETPAPPTASPSIAPTLAVATPSTGVPSPLASATTLPSGWVEAFALENAYLMDLRVGPEGLIASGCVRTTDGICGRGILLASPDGEDWTELELEGTTDALILSVRQVDDRLYALGYAYLSDDAGALVWTSLDGHSWSRIGADSFRGRAVQDVIASPAGNLAVGHLAPGDSEGSGFVTWDVGPGGSFGEATDVELKGGPGLVGGALWTGDEFLAWGVRGGPDGDWSTIVLASPEGKGWTDVAEVSALQAGAVQEVIVAGDVLVAVGFEGGEVPTSPRAWTSVDGRTWVLAEVPRGDGAMYSVRAEGSRLVARGRAYVGSSDRPATWTSIDGRVWTQLPDDVDMPTLLGFDARGHATVGDRICVAGFHGDDVPIAAIYCR